MDPITGQTYAKLSETIEEISKQNFVVHDKSINTDDEFKDSVKIEFVPHGTQVVVVPKREWESILYLRNIQSQNIESYKKKLSELQTIYDRDIVCLKRTIQLLAEDNS